MPRKKEIRKDINSIILINSLSGLQNILAIGIGYLIGTKDISITSISLAVAFVLCSGYVISHTITSNRLKKELKKNKIELKEIQIKNKRTLSKIFALAIILDDLVLIGIGYLIAVWSLETHIEYLGMIVAIIIGTITHKIIINKNLARRINKSKLARTYLR